MMNNITINDIATAVDRYKEYCKNKEIISDWVIIPPTAYEELLKGIVKDLTFRDNSKITIEDIDYYNFIECYGYKPEDCESVEDFRDKMMVMEL